VSFMLSWRDSCLRISKDLERGFFILGRDPVLGAPTLVGLKHVPSGPSWGA